MKASRFLKMLAPNRTKVMKLKDFLALEHEDLRTMAESKADEFFLGTKKNVYVLIIFGGRNTDFNLFPDYSLFGGWTYWIFESKKEPSVDEAIQRFIFDLEYYCFHHNSGDGDFLDHLENIREEYSVDLNGLNLHKEKRKHYLFNEKLAKAILSIFCGLTTEREFNSFRNESNTRMNKPMGLEDFISLYHEYVN